MLKAIVKNIQIQEIIHLVEFDLNGSTLKMISLELNEKIKIGTKVSLCIKSTHITIAKDLQGKLSCSNKIKAKVKTMKKGKLLSSVILEINEDLLEAIITTDALEQMSLNKSDEVIALIKASEISIKDIIDD